MSILKHTACHPGKKVKVVLRNGVIIFGKFKDRSSRHVFLTMGDGSTEKIDKSSIKVFSIYNAHVANIQHHVIQGN